MLIVNSEPISHFFPSVSILDFAQVNVSWDVTGSKSEVFLTLCGMSNHEKVNGFYKNLSKRHIEILQNFAITISRKRIHFTDLLLAIHTP